MVASILVEPMFVYGAKREDYSTATHPASWWAAVADAMLGSDAKLADHLKYAVGAAESDDVPVTITLKHDELAACNQAAYRIEVAATQKGRTSVANAHTLDLVRAFGAAVAEANAVLAAEQRGERFGPLAYPSASRAVEQAWMRLVEWAGRDYANGIADGVHWAAPDPRA